MPKFEYEMSLTGSRILTFDPQLFEEVVESLGGKVLLGEVHPWEQPLRYSLASLPVFFLLTGALQWASLMLMGSMPSLPFLISSLTEWTVSSLGL